MNTILVWVLVTIGGSYNNIASYSPPMADVDSCQRLLKAVKGLARNTQCIQISVPKP